MKNRLLLLLITLICAFSWSGISVFSEEELVDVSIHAPAVASSEMSADYSAKCANDGINDNEAYTNWQSTEVDAMPWWMVDLGMEYKLSSIVLEAAKGSQADERFGFRIIGSKSEDFSEYVTLVDTITEDYGIVLEKEISAERVRYVRVEKVSDGKLSIGEIRLYTKKDDILLGNETENSKMSQTESILGSSYQIYADVIGTEYEDAVYLLSQIGILNGYSDGHFKPQNEMTRAEFTAVMMRVLSYNVTGGAYFDDVPSSHWAYEQIGAAASLGIIAGTGNNKFSPNETVTLSQASKIIISALGYGDVAELQGGYPAGYNKLSESLGVFDKVLLGDESVNRGEIAIMICNALGVTMLRNTEAGGNINPDKDFDGTILSEKLGLSKKTGIVTGVSGTSLTNSNNFADEGYLEIDGIQYTSDIPDLASYLGLYVTYYHTTEDEDDMSVKAILVHKKNMVLEINASDIESVSQNRLSYWDGDKQKNEELSTKMYVIVNGKAMRTYETADLKPINGTVKLIDNNGDNVWDVYMITSVETYIVNFANADKNTIYTKCSTTPIVLNADRDMISIKKADTDENVTLSDLKEWDVISVSASKNSDGSKKFDILVSDKTVSGKLTESSSNSDYIKIDGVLYKIADNFDRTSVEVGDAGVFYISAENKVAYFKAMSNQQNIYGFLRKLWYNGEDEDVLARIYTQQGTWETYVLSEKLKVDTIPMSEYSVIDTHLKNNNWLSGSEAQPVKFSVNSKGEIFELDTVHPEADEQENALSQDAAKASRYYSASGVFGMSIACDNDTIMMVVPSDLTSDLDKEEDYNIITSASLSTGDYTVEGYNGGAERIMELMLFHQRIATGGSAKRFFVVDSVSYGINDDGIACAMVKGYADGVAVEFAESEPGIIGSDVKCGDILTLSLSGSGEIKAYQKKFYRDAELGGASVPSGAVSESSPQLPSEEASPYGKGFIAYGKVLTKENSFITADISHEVWLNSPILIAAQSTEMCVYYYDSENDTVRLGNIDDILDAKSVGADEACEIVVWIDNLDVKEIVILD